MRRIADAFGRLCGAATSLNDTELALLANSRGFDLVRRHYYSPVPQGEDLTRPGFWDEMSPLNGLDLREADALAFLSHDLPRYLAEFRSLFPVEGPPDGETFCVVNGVYMAVDAHVYYAMLRHHRPRRLIEVGSGQSTRVALEALSGIAARRRGLSHDPAGPLLIVGLVAAGLLAGSVHLILKLSRAQAAREAA